MKKESAKILRLISIVALFSFFALSGKAQKQGTVKSFLSLSRPEKCWVIFHPFVAKKGWKITQKVINITDSVSKTKVLDGDKNGGQVDAFRHSYWMAKLSSEIGWRKVLRLGKAHEKGNYLDYKKHRKEDGIFPDKTSGEMDMLNNKSGIELWKQHKTATDLELQQVVINEILAGKMKIIKKDKQGNYLDANNRIIPSDSLKGKWDNGKCLIDSDKKKE